MRYEAEIKELLIENAIHLIAEGGFEKATTKELTHCGGQLPDFKMNEVYIYRFFKSKENLYEAAFVRFDTELFYAFKHGVEIPATLFLFLFLFFLLFFLRDLIVSACSACTKRNKWKK